jgi:hypothetical protein
MFVARFESLSKVDEGERTEIGVRPGGMQFFDLETGIGIYDRVAEPARV